MNDLTGGHFGGMGQTLLFCGNTGFQDYGKTRTRSETDLRRL
ncbi:hypothetical protein [Bombella saccharophila]|uniref:Uncharacterized protein n=1 Tax=Bombella saccharophila TaxID=2967338 RepID=A0ABT3W6X3_9PROT|nr:hypothetical protein [Bombella saccharophila]MCX5614829.1 hypothetical protein [Bombella saccharophila]